MGWVLFFDGDCAFCSKSVRQVVHFDKRGLISFASLQGELSRKMGFTQYAQEGGGSMVLLRESDGKIFTHSDGPIELTRIFGGAWRILTLARFIPRPLRDAAYRWVARNRYRFMGKSDACSLPDPNFLARIRE